MTKEEIKEYMRNYRKTNGEEQKAYRKAYYKAHKEDMKAYYEAHKEDMKAYKKVHIEELKEYMKTYQKSYKKSDINVDGQTKASIRSKSWHYMRKYRHKIPGYEIHHCFGYEDAYKFIYISKALHLKIHQYLRDNKISADTNHWMAIRDIVNATDEFTYIKC